MSNDLKYPYDVPPSNSKHMKTKISENPHFGFQVTPIMAGDLQNSGFPGDYDAGRDLQIDAMHIQAGNPALK